MYVLMCAIVMVAYASDSRWLNTLSGRIFCEESTIDWNTYEIFDCLPIGDRRISIEIKYANLFENLK